MIWRIFQNQLCRRNALLQTSEKKNKQKKYGWLNSVHLITFFLSQAYRGLEFMPYENIHIKP